MADCVRSQIFSPHLFHPHEKVCRPLAWLEGKTLMTVDAGTVVFWIIAIVMVGSSLAVVLERNIVHAALALVVVFGAAAGIYILLNAEFIAIVQVLIYAGAVTILILFAIML